MKELNDYFAGQQIVTENETLARLEKYTYPGQTGNANPAHKIIRMKIMGLWGLGKRSNTMNSNVPLDEKKGVQSVYPASPATWFRNVGT